MRVDFFSLWGYVSVALWLAVPLLWAFHVRRRPRRWLVHIALAVAVAAYALAKVNSLTYVNRIQLDQSAMIAAAQAKAEEARAMARQARGEEVAQVRFAEDSALDSMDAGGMDAADLKYMESIDTAAEPEWKKDKKQRSGGGEVDNSIEASVSGESKPAGMGDGDAAGGVGRPPILMVEKDKALANRLDTLNLAVARLLGLLGLFFVVVDYLLRVNRYDEAYLPLPLPGAWTNALVPPPAFLTRPIPARRSIAAELAWVTRRGEAFVYLTADPAAASAVPDRLARLPRGLWPVEVLHVAADDGVADDAFLFEALWFNRASCVVASAERAEAFLKSMARLLDRRTEKRARTRHTVHLFWDMGRPLPDEWRLGLETLARATGWSVVEVPAHGHESRSPR